MVPSSTDRPLVLLHAALGAASQFDALASCLADRFTVHRFDFEGHGVGEPASRPFRMESFVANTLTELHARGLQQADIFGYSMGGYVAMLLARDHPGMVGSIMTLGTKWRWDPETSAREARLLDPAKIQAKVPAFARTLAQRHRGAGWERVLEYTAEMMHDLGTGAPLDDDILRTIPHRVRLVVGDRDATVTVEETASVFRQLRNAELEVLPGTPHPLEKANLAALADSIASFFETHAEVPTASNGPAQ